MVPDRCSLKSPRYRSRMLIWSLAFWGSACLIVSAGAGAAGREPLHDRARFRVAYATYIGGDQWDQAREVLPYPDGSVLVGAQTCSRSMPATQGAVQPRYAGDDPGLGHPGIYGGDCYVARLDASGRRVLMATYFGGSKQERNIYGMELDRAGNIAITSMTRSPDLPCTPGCFQEKHGGGKGTTFVAKVSADLKTLLWCTYLGGSGDESPRGGLALDADDNVAVFGTTNSADFPTTVGSYQTSRDGPRDAFVAKLKSNGSGLVWSTLYGGSAEDYMVGGRIDSAGDIYFAGHTTSNDLPATERGVQPRYGGQHDGYVAKLSADGARVRYATYVGGSANEFPEHRPFVFPDGSLLLAGVSGSSDFPVTPVAFQRTRRGGNDAFLTHLSSDGRRFEFATFLGGDMTDVSLMPTPAADGNIYVVGQTESRNLPVTEDAIQKQFGGGESDGWLALVSRDGRRLLYCSYVGGSGEDMVRSLALGPHNELYLVGHTASRDFPVTRDAAQTTYGGGRADAFVMKLAPTRNAASPTNR